MTLDPDSTDMNGAEPSLHADRLLTGGRVLTLDDRHRIDQAIALSGNRILATGSDAELRSLAGPATQVIELNGRTVMPGLIDGHAHLDREGLKGLLPSLAGCRSIGALIERLQQVARDTPPGRWIVTMPLGEPPEYAANAALFEDGRLPDRHDLDAATSEHPVLIRCAWGYWPGELPMVSIANSAALALAGIGRSTISPSPKLVIERDRHGDATGRFFEHAFQPLAEFTLFRRAPHFSADDRMRTMEASMHAYNAFGTTGVFEGHGVSGEVIDAWRLARRMDRQTVRGHLIVSGSFNGMTADDVAHWVTREAPRLRRRRDAGEDAWLRLEGLYAEPETDAAETRLRAACAPRTGWAGFHYDAGLPPDALRRLLHAAASEGLRVCGIQTAMADLFLDVARSTPIAGLRWVVAHPATLDHRQIAGMADHGLCVTTLTGAYVWRRASALMSRIGEERQNEICPIGSLVAAGVPVALATDNVPVSLWPCIWHATERIDRTTGSVIAPAQRVDRITALRCATANGAWLCGDESERGTLQAGKLADLIVLREDPLTVDAQQLPHLKPDFTMVDGRIVWSAVEPTP